MITRCASFKAKLVFMHFVKIRGVVKDKSFKYLGKAVIWFIVFEYLKNHFQRWISELLPGIGYLRKGEFMRIGLFLYMVKIIYIRNHFSKLCNTFVSNNIRSSYVFIIYLLLWSDNSDQIRHIIFFIITNKRLRYNKRKRHDIICFPLFLLITLWHCIHRDE
jgi:hypothetical protein